jgi:hypothetical protein
MGVISCEFEVGQQKPFSPVPNEAPPKLQQHVHAVTVSHAFKT